MTPGISSETILSMYWYSYHIRSYIVAVLVETATKLLNFATKLGLAWWNVVRFDKKCVSDSSPRIHVPLNLY